MVLDRYRILEIISGAMGNVFISEHLGWQVKLAIKAPRPEVLTDLEGFNRIKKEAEGWINMGMHPNIATCYYVLTLDEVPFLFIEYVNGGSLHDWITLGRCRDLRNTLSLAIQFCHGMEFTHSKGIIHRDIKPRNILLTRDSLLKITDFGIMLNTADPAPQNQLPATAQSQHPDITNGFRGTPGFASPEQFRDTHRVDRRTDIFSFGVCLWLMLCGRKPFERNDLELPPPTPRPQANGIKFPPVLSELLKRSVAYDPDERIGDFTELRSLLNEAHLSLYGVPSPYYNLTGIDLRSESLNNHAISLSELDRGDQAIEALYHALDINDSLTEAIYNLAIIRWKRNEANPAHLIRQLTAASKRLKEKEFLLALAEKIKNRSTTDSPSSFEYPELKLCPPPSSLQIYREDQLRNAIHQDIQGHLKAGRNQECQESLLASWRTRRFVKERLYTTTYQALIKTGKKHRAIAIIRLNTLQASSRAISSLACIDGKWIIAADGTKRIILWDPIHKKKSTITNDNGEKVTSLLVNPTRPVLYIYDERGRILSWSPLHPAPQVICQLDSAIVATCINDSGSVMATIDRNNILGFIDLANNSLISKKIIDPPITSLAFTGHHRDLVMGTNNGLIHYYEEGAQLIKMSIEAHGNGVTSLLPSPSQGRFHSVGQDGWVKHYESSSGLLLKSFRTEANSPLAALSLPEKTLILTDGGDDLIHLCNWQSADNLDSLDCRGNGVSCLAKGPRPHIILAGCRNGSIVLVMVLYELTFD
ncbi:MAG: protein kinase [Proteobacteria bacterium]|nr:protein kinase [Pseudomonadota bacterium]MBU1688053.1 protein kinase [Pseudomonadota bacterium]